MLLLKEGIVIVCNIICAIMMSQIILGIGVPLLCIIWALDKKSFKKR